MVTIAAHLTILKEQIKNTVWWLKEHLIIRSTAKVSDIYWRKESWNSWFTGTTVSEQSLEFKMTDVTGKQEIKFLLETDDGSNNTCVYGYELYYIGDVKPLPDAPTPASVGAVSTGKYRNLFKELGYSDAEIDKKVESAWQNSFMVLTKNESIIR